MRHGDRLSKLLSQREDEDGKQLPAESTTEIQFNQFIFQVTAEGKRFRKIHTLNGAFPYVHVNDAGLTLSPTCRTTAVGDVTGDGRDDILSYRSDDVRQYKSVLIYSLTPLDEGVDGLDHVGILLVSDPELSLIHI